MEQPAFSPEQPAQHKQRPGKFFWGIILIFAGVFVLSQQLGWLGPNFNWWAVFIFIPAIGSLTGAYTEFRKNGRFNAGVRSAFGSGLIILTVAFILLFGLSWRLWWPLMVIVPGFSLFLNGIGGLGTSSSAKAFINMTAWLGIGAMFLGTGFLLENLGLLSLSELLVPYRWWALAILIPALGALVNGLIQMVRKGPLSWSAISLLVFGLSAAAVGIIAFLGLSWNILGPVLLILVGLGFLLGVFGRS